MDAWGDADDTACFRPPRQASETPLRCAIRISYTCRSVLSYREHLPSLPNASCDILAELAASIAQGSGGSNPA